MYKKGNGYFADWWEHGRRKRKGFTTAKEANAYQLKMRSKSRPIKPSPRSPHGRVLTHPGSSETRIFESKVNIPEKNRKKLVKLLNARLVDTIDLQTQTKFAHWNVKGSDFYHLHLLFDEIAERLEEAVDLIAERITALGGRANGTLRQAAENSSIPEYDVEMIRGMDHVRTLVDRLSLMANGVRKAIDESDKLEDKGTSDLFTEIVRIADKDLYFLEAHLQA